MASLFYEIALLEISEVMQINVIFKYSITKL